MKEKPIIDYTTTCGLAHKHEHNPAYGACPFCLEVYIGENHDFIDGDGIICHKCGAKLRMGSAYLPEDGDEKFEDRMDWVDAKHISTPDAAVEFMRYAVVRKDSDMVVRFARAIVEASKHWGKNRNTWFKKD